MSEEKKYWVADEMGNHFEVLNWDGITKELTDFELESLYYSTKFDYAFSEIMDELITNKKVERKGSDYPYKDVANSIDYLAEIIGKERVTEIDKDVQKALEAKKDNQLNPSNFIHLN